MARASAAVARRNAFAERIADNRAISFRAEGIAPYLLARTGSMTSASTLIRETLKRYWLLCEYEAANLPTGLDVASIAEDIRPHMPLDPAGVFGIADLVQDTGQRALLRRLSRAQRCALVDMIEREGVK